MRWLTKFDGCMSARALVLIMALEYQFRTFVIFLLLWLLHNARRLADKFVINFWKRLLLIHGLQDMRVMLHKLDRRGQIEVAMIEGKH